MEGFVQVQTKLYVSKPNKWLMLTRAELVDYEQEGKIVSSGFTLQVYLDVILYSNHL